VSRSGKKVKKRVSLKATESVQFDGGKRAGGGRKISSVLNRVVTKKPDTARARQYGGDHRKAHMDWNTTSFHGQSQKG